MKKQLSHLLYRCYCCDSRVDLDMLFDATTSMHGDDLSCADLGHCCFVSIRGFRATCHAVCQPNDLREREKQ